MVRPRKRARGGERYRTDCLLVVLPCADVVRLVEAFAPEPKVDDLYVRAQIYGSVTRWHFAAVSRVCPTFFVLQPLEVERSAFRDRGWMRFCTVLPSALRSAFTKPVRVRRHPEALDWMPWDQQPRTEVFDLTW